MDRIFIHIIIIKMKAYFPSFASAYKLTGPVLNKHLTPSPSSGPGRLPGPETRVRSPQSRVCYRTMIPWLAFESPIEHSRASGDFNLLQSWT